MLNSQQKQIHYLFSLLEFTNNDVGLLNFLVSSAALIAVSRRFFPGFLTENRWWEPCNSSWIDSGHSSTLLTSLVNVDFSSVMTCLVTPHVFRRQLGAAFALDYVHEIANFEIWISGMRISNNFYNSSNQCRLDIVKCSLKFWPSNFYMIQRHLDYWMKFIWDRI